MRTKWVTLILVVIALCLMTSCGTQKGKIEIYSFAGENDNIAIHNGLIIITDKEEKFIGGDLSFKGEKPSSVKNSEVKFYFYKDGVETIIQDNMDSINGTTAGTTIQQDTGSSSSEKLFYGNDLELIKGSLNFSLRGTLVNGESFEYKTVLAVKKVY